jgi:imidazolonepropionase-like amidohydrolase
MALPVWPAGTRVRLENGRVVDVATGKHHPPGTSLVVCDGRIVALPGSPEAADERPADVVVDLHGLHVVPGLCSTHNHLQIVLPSLLAGVGDLWLARRNGRRQIEKNAADCLLHGVTVVRDAWSEDLRLNRRLREKIDARTIPGPHIRQSVLVSQRGGTFGMDRGFGDRVICSLAGIPVVPYDDPASGVVVFAADAGARAVRDAVDRAVDERAAECIKLYDQREWKVTYAPGATLMTQEQLDAAADQARRRGVPSTLHHVTVESFRRGVRAGITSLVHVPADAALSPADVAAFVAAGCILEPTLSLAYDLNWDVPGFPTRDSARLRRLSEFRAASFGALVQRFWLPELWASALRGRERSEQGRTRLFGVLDLSRVFRYFAGVVGPGMDNVRALFAAGGRVACGNDAGAIPRTPAMIGLELTLLDFALREGGGRLAGADALRIAALHSAATLGLAGTRGAIAPGMVADLALYERDPLADHSLLGSPVAALFLDGRLAIDRVGLHATPTPTGR